jgi:hypothetical protein
VTLQKQTTSLGGNFGNIADQIPSLKNAPMTNQTFNFTGDWEFILELPELVAYFSETSTSSHDPIKKIRVEIQDDLSENPDPNLEQLNTLQYILENQKLIAEKACIKVLEQMPQIIRDYNLEAERDHENLTIDDIKELVRVTSVYIQIDIKEGYAYYDLFCNCQWDEEHGLNLLFWKDNPIWMGQSDGSSGWEAIKDNGTYDQVVAAQKNFVPAKPKLFVPHPKYGKLKPSQEFANKSYALNLMRQNMYVEFIEYINQSDTEQGKLQELFRDALQSNRTEIIQFLEPKVKLDGLIHWFWKSSSIIDYLLKKGVSINETDHYQKTILAKAMFEFRYLLTIREEYKLRNPGATISNEHIEKCKQDILWLISKGADVNHKSIESAYAFSSNQYDSKKLIEEMKDLLRPFQTTR